MSKAIMTTGNFTPYGGAVPILKKIKEFGLPQVIRSSLGVRKKQSKYGYDDVFIAWALTTLCGGTRLDHITKLKKKFNVIPKLKLPSHDVIGRVFKQLADDINVYKSTYIKNVKDAPKKKKEKIKVTKIVRGKHIITDRKVIKNKKEIKTYKVDAQNFVCDNIKLNNMLVKATKRMGGLREGQSYTLHIDATFVETNSSNSEQYYNSTDSRRYGFNPMVCVIQKFPVYISMRNGNSSSDFQLKECIENCLDILSKNKIKVGKVIIDGAGYHRATIDFLHQKGIKFIISAPVNKYFKSMLEKVRSNENWKNAIWETGHGYRNCEVSSVLYSMTGLPYDLRIVAARHLTKDSIIAYSNLEEQRQLANNEQKLIALAKKGRIKKQDRKYEGDWREIGNYKYRFIITNDFSMQPEKVITSYNKRGNDIERKFDEMKNFFGWKLPPFSQMNENGVFLIAAALSNNIYYSIISNFKSKIPELRKPIRLGEFKFLFIDVVCEYVGKGFYKFINPLVPYDKLM
ncbi:MAG: transposase [Bacteroidota bacterium]